MTDQLEGQISWFDHDLQFTKTSPEHSPQTEGGTSKPSSRRSSASQSQTPPMCLCLKRDAGLRPDASMMIWDDGRLLGAYMTHSFGESPNEERESLLSQILEDSPHPKYNLSAKACLGILNRAKKRGKKLPEVLEAALIRQAHLS